MNETDDRIAIKIINIKEIINLINDFFLLLLLLRLKRNEKVSPLLQYNPCSRDNTEKTFALDITQSQIIQTAGYNITDIKVYIINKNLTITQYNVQLKATLFQSYSTYNKSLWWLLHMDLTIKPNHLKMFWSELLVSSVINFSSHISHFVTSMKTISCYHNMFIDLLLFDKSLIITENTYRPYRSHKMTYLLLLLFGFDCQNLWPLFLFCQNGSIQEEVLGISPPNKWTESIITCLSKSTFLLQILLTRRNWL